MRTELLNSTKNINVLEELFLKCYYIREVEELIAREYPSQVFRCPVHLSVGQEAIAAGVCSALTTKDKVISTHRSHAHYLAKGGNLLMFFAELMGRVGGCCNGRGGSMHIFDKEAGFFSSVPIVGSSLPIAAGIALADLERKEGQISVAFVGDAVIESGQFHEALNIISLFKLPVMVVIEDNLYSTYARKETRQSKNLNVEKIVQGFGLGYQQGNGDDVLSVFTIATNAIKAVRENKPQVLKFDTFRLYEHCGPNRDDEVGYREVGEIEKFMNRDPLKIAKIRLENEITFSDIETKQYLIKENINETFEKSKKLPLAGLEMMK